MKQTHEYFMRKCFALAQQGQGHASPNPLVGAIVVKNNRIIATGYHAFCGGPHAEVAAFDAATESVAGATLYCNLEPCCHTQKQTPPCVERIIKEQIAHVVVANIDPNPSVNGKGLSALQQAGIKVTTEILADQGQELNEIFFHYIRTGNPFVHLKYAQTLDGAVATASGDARWISNEAARKKVHELRMRYDAVLIGRNTLLTDNPQLAVRYGYERIKACPWRVVLSDLASLQPGLQLLEDEFAHKTIIITSSDDLVAYPQLVAGLRNKKISVYAVVPEEGLLPLEAVFKLLVQKHQITSILVEGGSQILTSCLKQQLYQKLSVFIAPKLIGSGIPSYQNQGIMHMNDALKLSNVHYEIIEDNIHLMAQPSVLRKEIV